MTQTPEDTSWRVLREIADRETTRSVRRTINAAILIRAAQRSPPQHTTPRKASKVWALLGVAVLLVSQHQELLRILIHLFAP